MTVKVNSLEREIFETEEDDSVGNSFTCSIYENKANLTIDNPWAGDTESGFGQTSYISLSKADAVAFAHFILSIFDPV